jgi:hypothetical protein
VDAHEQEQHRCRSDDEQGRCWLTREHHRRDDDGGVGDTNIKPVSVAAAVPMMT